MRILSLILSPLAVLCILFPAGARNVPTTTRILLNYDFGGPAGRSRIILLTNGLLMRNEITNGKLRFLPDMILTPLEVINIMKAIDGAEKKPSVSRDFIPAMVGQPDGGLAVFKADGGEINIYSFRDNGKRARVTVCHTGAEAESIRAFVAGLVRDKPPLRIPACL